MSNYYDQPYDSNPMRNRVYDLLISKIKESEAKQKLYINTLINKNTGEINVVNSRIDKTVSLIDKIKSNTETAFKELKSENNNNAKKITLVDKNLKHALVHNNNEHKRMVEAIKNVEFKIDHLPTMNKKEIIHLFNKVKGHLKDDENKKNQDKE